MSAPLPIDTYMHAQDQLVLRLTAGRLSTRRLTAEHAAHVAVIMRAGYTYNEAECAFWDALAMARHCREQSASQEGAA